MIERLLNHNHPTSIYKSVIAEDCRGGERDCNFSPPIYVFLNLGGGVANKGLFFIEGGGGGGGMSEAGGVSNPYEIKRRVQKI